MNLKKLSLTAASLPVRALLVQYIYGKWAVKRWGGLKGLLDARISDGQLDVDHIELPAELRKRFQRLFLLRGLTYDNCLMSSEATEIIDAMLAHCEQHYDPTQIRAKSIEAVDFEEMRDAERFYDKYVKVPRPVVIKNFKMNKDKWSMEYFSRVFEKYPVLVTNLDTQEHKEQDFGEFYRSKERTYIHTNESLWYGDPTLEQSIPFREFEGILKRNLMTAHLFVGKTRTSITPFHCANNYNVFFQLKGRKEWTFVNPEYTYLMYPASSRFRAYYASRVMSAESCDTDRFPLFKYCPRYHVALEEGDLLINPPYWWHSVQALTEETISVASRWGSMGQATMFGTSSLQDVYDTNHLFTAISALAPWNAFMTLGECAKLLHINHGRIELSSKIKGNTTLYETGSHDDLPIKFARGELDTMWQHRGYVEKDASHARATAAAATPSHAHRGPAPGVTREN